MTDDDSYSTNTSVSDEEGHSTILMAHTRICTRLILIYLWVVFTHTFFGFYCGLRALDCG